MFDLTFKTAGRRLLRVTQQVHAEGLRLRLTAEGEDTGAQVVSWTQRPAARVLEKCEGGGANSGCVNTSANVDKQQRSSFCKWTQI